MKDEDTFVRSLRAVERFMERSKNQKVELVHVDLDNQVACYLNTDDEGIIHIVFYLGTELDDSIVLAHMAKMMVGAKLLGKLAALDLKDGTKLSIDSICLSTVFNGSKAILRYHTGVE